MIEKCFSDVGQALEWAATKALSGTYKNGSVQGIFENPDGTATVQVKELSQEEVLSKILGAHVSIVGERKIAVLALTEKELLQAKAKANALGAITGVYVEAVYNLA